MSEEKTLRWRKVKDKEPGDGNIMLYTRSAGCVFVTYLPPRRGSELGDWDDGNETWFARPNDRYLEADDLMTADAIDGLVSFVPRRVKR